MSLSTGTRPGPDDDPRSLAVASDGTTGTFA